ncbi:MAG TPA: addiction module protein [Opitutaceae bacterium]|nr:addiction module protein [Opitutaceae bacterium]
MRPADIPELQSASPTERIELIDELWASISRDTLPTPDSHLSELERRETEVKADPTCALTPEEARRRIRSQTGL